MSKRVIGLLFMITCVAMLSGCYTYAGISKNSVPFETADSDLVTWEEASRDIIPKLEDGLMTMTEEDVYKLFKRPPNERQAYSDAISVISKSPALLTVTGRSSGNLSMSSTIYVWNKIPKLRGAVWTFASGSHKNFKTIITDHTWDTNRSFLVLTLFYDGKLATMQVMSTEDFERISGFTSEKLVHYAIEGVLYSLPAIILASAITKASDRLASGMERSADSVGGSIERGSKNLSGSIDGASNSIDNTGLSSISKSLKNVSGASATGSVTTPDGTVMQGTVTVPK